MYAKIKKMKLKSHYLVATKESLYTDIANNKSVFTSTFISYSIFFQIEFKLSHWNVTELLRYKKFDDIIIN